MAFWTSKLIFITTEEDDTNSSIWNRGRKVNQEPVFADKKPTTTSDFRTALAAGREVIGTYDIYTVNYQNQKEVEIDGQVYEVFKTRENGDITQIVVTNKSSIEV